MFFTLIRRLVYKFMILNIVKSLPIKRTLSSYYCSIAHGQIQAVQNQIRSNLKDFFPFNCLGDCRHRRGKGFLTFKNLYNSCEQQIAFLGNRFPIKICFSVFIFLILFHIIITLFKNSLYFNRKI